MNVQQTYNFILMVLNVEDHFWGTADEKGWWVGLGKILLQNLKWFVQEEDRVKHIIWAISPA